MTEKLGGIGKNDARRKESARKKAPLKIAGVGEECKGDGPKMEE